jgi:hypothetical protein
MMRPETRRVRPGPAGKAGPLRRPGPGDGRAAGPLTSALLAAARSGEAELRPFAATIDAERMAGAAALAAHLAETGALAPASPWSGPGT